MNPDEVKELQQLQELLTKFNSEASFIRAEKVTIMGFGDEDALIGRLAVGEDNETMFFTQSTRK